MKYYAKDYDVIVTGDLGSAGKQLVVELMAKEGYEMDERYTDCGIEIFDAEKQDTHAGGSGCACSAVTFCAYFYPKLLSLCSALSGCRVRIPIIVYKIQKNPP